MHKLSRRGGERLRDDPAPGGQVYPYTVKVLTNWAIINKEQDGVKAPVQHQYAPREIPPHLPQLARDFPRIRRTSNYLILVQLIGGKFA